MKMNETQIKHVMQQPHMLANEDRSSPVSYNKEDMDKLVVKLNDLIANEGSDTAQQYVSYDVFLMQCRV